MASGITHAPLTLEQFHQRYASEKGWEFWCGEAIRKPVPTWYHAILQTLLAELLHRAGFFAGAEIELRIDPDWEPRPDVIAATEISGPYPTKPVEIVIEILSNDQMSTLLSKCAHYAQVGIPGIYVFDPEGRRSWRWSAASNDLERCTELQLRNGAVLRCIDIWAEFQRRIPIPKQNDTSSELT